MSNIRIPTTVIQPSQGLFPLGLPSLWEYRELVYFLVWRDIKVRYKQTAIGAAWAVLQPLITILIFTLIFGRFAKIPSEGLPYPLFAFAALLPWNFFAQAVTRGANSLVANAHLLTKVYFPRILVPIASAFLPAVDSCFSLLALAGLMVWYGISPSWRLLALPLFFLLAVMTTLAVGLLLSPINVRYRDVAHALPFVIQVWMYASPVVYPTSLVPADWRLLYSLNPLVGVIEGFRWALLNMPAPDFTAMAISSAMVLCLLLGGATFFKSMDPSFADVV